MKYLVEDTTLTNVANSIRTKEGSTETIKVGDFASKIANLPTGIDTSDATATAEDILKDKTAYVKGEKITGTFEGGEIEPKFTGHYDKEGLMTKLGWTEEDVDYYQQNGVQWNEENDNEFIITNEDVINAETSNAKFLNKTTQLKIFNNYRVLVALPLLDTSNVKIMANMFNYCYSLITIPQLDTSNVTNMASMFSGCRSLIKIPQLNTHKVDNMNSMFSNCNSLKTIPQIDTSNVTSMTSMFNSCHSLIKIPQLNTHKVENMNNMFSYCYPLTTIPQLDTSNVTNMSYMFASCLSLNTIPQLNTSNVTNVNNMFTNCYSLTTIPQIDISNVTLMHYMFNYCYSLIAIPQLDTRSAMNMNSMFNNCSSLVAIPQLNTSNVTNVNNILNSCYSLKYLGGFANLGQAYSTTSSENTSNYKLDLSASTLLTRDSLMNVINNLYDIKSKGCKNQALVLGTKNLAKLTEEEIAIATNKGWNVS